LRLAFFLICLLVSCGRKPSKDFTSVPGWMKEVVWYQIFVERFRNGDTSNDPELSDMEGSYPGVFPRNWSITPWGHDWYAHEIWLDSARGDDFSSKIQARRYGGDLQGVLDKLDYLKDLGITAIYFNPLNDSPSLHKYDAASYVHIDRNFGPDPDHDISVMRSEDPDDPLSWKWTSADSMFLKVINECHKRRIRVVVDYSWNHTGPNFFAFRDVKEKGKDSKYRDWYIIRKYDDPETPENEFEYEGWGGDNPWMPVFRKDIIPPDNKHMPFEGNLHSRTLKEHIFSVTRRWLDPDGDGNPNDGIDGFRMDVAGEIPMGFWREYRQVVKNVNPEACLIGEIWWQEYPDKLMDPAVFLKGDQFDAVMNYRWYRVARGLFAQGEPALIPSEFVTEIVKLNSGMEEDNLSAMMNVAATHDTPRLSTSIFNKSRYKVGDKPSENPDYKIGKPDERTRKEQMLLLVHQFTYSGAPHIWNGDEMGMWGADDPDCRKPLIWGDIQFDVEKANYYPEKERTPDTVRQDVTLIEFYKSLIRMRKENSVLVHGKTNFFLADDSRMVLGYSRKDNEREIAAIFNISGDPQIVKLKIPGRAKILITSGKSQISGDEIYLDPLSSIAIKVR
ncbi:MAG TPA: glycoside hydrolase family 13 protein, partial [Bacteroidales bacterium]|nr:glycoside hydrolase family 13 protein [Bacteroidales bacterium]